MGVPEGAPFLTKGTDWETVCREPWEGKQVEGPGSDVG